MFTIYDVKNRSGYFCNCAKQAFSLLRFSSINDILKLESDCKHLIANIVETLSCLVYSANIFLDILSKNVIENYVSSLKESVKYISGEQNSRYISSISKMSDDVGDYVAERLGIVDEKIDIVEDSASYIEPNVGDYAFRDALQAANIASKIYSADEFLSSEKDKNFDKTEAEYGIFYEKYNNEAVSMISNMRNCLNKINDLRNVLDSCLVAKYIRSYYSINNIEDAVDFLNCSEFELINKAIAATENNLKSNV